METARICGACTACCHVAEVKEGIVDKPACVACPFLNHGCTLFGKPERPQVCTSFQCAWLRGFGSKADRPNQSGVMVSINEVNGGNWIMVMDLIKNAHLTTGKHMIIDIATKIDLPVIIVDYDNLEEGRGDYVLVKNSLEPRSKQIRGEFISAYTDTMNIYKLIMS